MLSSWVYGNNLCCLDLQNHGRGSIKQPLNNQAQMQVAPIERMNLDTWEWTAFIFGSLSFKCHYFILHTLSNNHPVDSEVIKSVIKWQSIMLWTPWWNWTFPYLPTYNAQIFFHYDLWTKTTIWLKGKSSWSHHSIENLSIVLLTFQLHLQ